MVKVHFKSKYVICLVQLVEKLVFKGKPYNDYDPEELRQRISYLMQQSDLFGETIEDNMIFPSLARNDKFDRKRAKQLIKMSVWDIIN